MKNQQLAKAEERAMSVPPGRDVPPFGFLVAAVVTVWLAVAALVYFIPTLFPSLKFETAGQLGDMFGAVNALFSGLAFVILTVALVLQSRELKLQRDELTHQRTELRLQREEFERQNDTLAAQRFENTFFQLLRTHSEIVAGMRASRAVIARAGMGSAPTEGRECFSIFYGLCTSSVASHGPREGYDRFYKIREARVGHYFRHLYHLVKFVDESDVSNKRQYTKFVRAQLSSYESLLLFYNCLSAHGENFKPLVERYALLQTMNYSELADFRHVELYAPEAFGKSEHSEIQPPLENRDS